MMRNIFAIMMASILTAVAVAAELVVIESTSPDYLVGDILDDEGDLVLDEGAKITMIAEDGMVISLEGPHVGPPALDEVPAGSSVLDALGQLVGDAETQTGDIGGVRGDAIGEEYWQQTVDDHRTSPWMLHTAITGPQCVRENSTNVECWREQNDSEGRLEIKLLTSGEVATITWQAGDNAVAWPDALPILADEMYLLRLGDELRSTNLQLRVVPATVADQSVEMVAFLAANGCISQARMEFDRIRRTP